MSFTNYLSKLPSNWEDDQSPDQIKEALSLARINPNSETFHIAFPVAQPDDISVLLPDSDPAPIPSEGILAVYRRHFEVHGPSCEPEMACDLREKQSPDVVAQSVGIPRAHIVGCPRCPVSYNLEELWARPLSNSPLVDVGDRLWVEGIGEVELQESSVAKASPFWKFFSDRTLDDRIIEVATEWRFVRLTPEEYERRASALYAGRDVGTAEQQQQSFLDFEEDEGRLRAWIGIWRGFYSRFVAFFFRRAAEAAV